MRHCAENSPRLRRHSSFTQHPNAVLSQRSLTNNTLAVQHYAHTAIFVWWALPEDPRATGSNSKVAHDIVHNERLGSCLHAASLAYC